jgi:protein-S-isoprenylcysteine O-methyltransferase Ste14
MIDAARVRVLPPILLAAALGGSLLLRLAFPAVRYPLPAAAAVWSGAVVIVLSVFLLAWAARELHRFRTPFDVRRPTQAIVRSGPFRLSRNPVYLSMVLLLLGLGAALDSPLMLAVAWPFGSALCRAVIKPEERYLEHKFGRAYLDYRTHVRRWI